MRHGGLGAGLGSFFVGFRGRVRVGDSISGVIYNWGKDLFRFFVYLPCRPPRPPLVRHWGFTVVFVGFRGRVRVGDRIRGVIYNRGKDLFRFFCLFTLPATMATPATPQETSIIGTRRNLFHSSKTPLIS